MSATLLKRYSDTDFSLCKIFKNTFFYRAPPVAASEIKEVFGPFSYDYVAFCLKHVALQIISISFSSNGD